MAYQLDINDIKVAVTPKAIKNLHLAVYPPFGEVRVSAPLWMDENHIKYYVLSKISWIKQRQAKYQNQAREEKREFLNMETHYIWGEPFLLKIHPNAAKNEIKLDYDILNLHVTGIAVKEKMSALLQSWYRQIVRVEANKKIAHWRGIFKLGEVDLSVRHMKTRWGSCLPLKNKILLNTELAKKPRECLNYVVVHELAHFFVPNHGQKFTQFMNQYLPDWKNTRKLLNSLPLGI